MTIAVLLWKAAHAERYDGGTGMKRENTRLISEILKEFIARENLTDGINAVRVLDAYVKTVGPELAAQTVKKYFREGTLVCHVDSAAARSRLFMKREEIADSINRMLGRDEVRRIYFK